MLQTQYYGIQVSSLRKQTDKPTDYYNPWLPMRLGLINPNPIWQAQ